MSNATSPLTALQMGMLFHSLNPDRPGVDTEHVVIRLNESFDVDRFVSAWRTVITASPALRTSFDWEDAVAPRRLTQSSFELPVDILDWSDRSSVTATELADVQASDRSRSFDLRTVPMRMIIVALPNNQTWILWSFHHILLDGRSFPMVLRSVFGHYDNPGSDRVDLGWSSFDDFAEKQSLLGAAQLEGWEQKLEGHQAQPLWSLEPSNQPLTSEFFGSLEHSLSEATTTALRNRAAELGCSLNNLVQAAWSILQHRYLGQDRITFASTRACRHLTPEAKNTVGLLINTVPFTINVDRTLSVEQFVHIVRDEHQSLRDLEAAPLTQVLQVSGLERSSDLFESLVMYDEASLGPRLADLGNNRDFRYEGQTNFPLALLAYGDAQFLARLEYDRQRFSDAAARRILDQFCLILWNLTASASMPVGDIGYLTAADEELLTSYNETTLEYPAETLVDLLERQVQKTPDSVALRMGTEELTYNEFNRRVNIVAHVLRARGVGANSVVGVYGKRSFEMLVAIHAIAKAGGAYLPLDPDYPTDRLLFMVEDSACELALAAGHAGRSADRLAIPILDLDDPTSLPLHGDETNPDTTIDPADAAYVLFTSGSTGRPKGVINEHRGILNRLQWMQDTFALDNTDVVLHKTPFTFDVSIWELFWPLQVGATLAIAPPDAHRDPRVLVDEMTQASVTTMHFVPSMLAHFVEEPTVTRCTTLRRVICSGEALSRDLQDRAFRRLNSELHNLYGPTEAAIDVTWWQCDKDSTSSTVPIGFAIANTTMHIVDANLQAVPPGAQGELLIGGIQVARGYAGRPELTAERFLEAGSITGVGSRTYRTGDLGRYHADGSIEYLGRTDHQVKIRGQRIELGEIEASIMETPWVTNCVVVDREDRPGNRELAAYIEAESTSLMANSPDSEWQTQLRGRLGLLLADYMIPATFTMLDTLPLSTAGKIDRASLPAPRQAPRSVEAPSGQNEARVARVWSELLNYADIDRSVPFFQAGGHSLLIIALAQQLSAEFNKEVAITDLLDKATVALQAKFLGTDAKAQDEINLANTVAKRKQGSNRRRRGRVANRRG